MHAASKFLGVAAVLLAGLAFATALATRSQLQSLRGDRRKEEEASAQLKARLEAMDRKLDRAWARSSSAAETPPPEPPRGLKREAPPKAAELRLPGAPPQDEEEFEELKGKVFAGGATDAERDRFWKLVGEKPGLLDDLIKQLEKASADFPRDKEALRRLSEAYLAKLMAVPDGMQKGAWSNKMIGVSRKILEVDPQDWDARFSIAINYSFWPEQFNKRPDAIKEFQTLKRIQEGRPSDPKFAQTYLQLRQLYLKEGLLDEAKVILEEGLQRFPEDAELIKARDGAK